MSNILIIGANSAIAREAARCWAARGASLFLVARDSGRLNILEEDVKARGAEKVKTHLLDINDVEKQPGVLDQAVAFLGTIDVILMAHGTLPDQKACEAKPGLAARELETNFTSSILFLLYTANLLERQKMGTLAVITSVAGDRGRQSNYIYGAAKGGMNTFLQGLRNRLYFCGVNVLTIKPGFVNTPMTASARKNVLFVSPQGVARDIIGAIDCRKSVVYTPWFWTVIMACIKALPEVIFKRLKL